MRTMFRWFRRVQFVALTALILASLAVLVAGIGRPTGADPQTNSGLSKRAEQPTEETLDKLLKAYRLYGLPEPPADAPLVSFSVPAWAGDRRLRTIGFQLKPEKEGGPVRVFWGLGRIDELDCRQTAKSMEPRPESFKDIELGVDDVFAIQCHARGWTELALSAIKANWDNRRQADRVLAMDAWRYWESTILQPEGDRATIARQLKVIAPDLGDDIEKVDCDLPRAIELAMAPGEGKPGTVEALIDGLVDVTATDRSAVAPRPPHPAYVEVARLGFDAVPGLIAHLGDPRLTRAEKETLTVNRGHIYRVGDVAYDLLDQLAEPDLGILVTGRHDKTDFERWWSKAQKDGEEAYCVQHVLDRTKPHERVNWPMVTILAHKYPKRLPEVYRRMIDERPGMYGGSLAAAVADSTLPNETKRDLFVKGSQSSGWHHRKEAIEHLRTIDRAEAMTALVATIKAVPDRDRDPDQFETWDTGWLAGKVIEWDDPTAWAGLEEAAPRWPIRLQHNVIDAMDRADRETARAERLRFLSHFLHGIVWKHAARAAGEIIGLRKPMPYWTNQDWEDLVENIESVVARKR